MNFKPIKLKNGTVYMCPYKVDTASEEIHFKDIIIAELADRYEEQSVIMDEMAEALQELKSIVNIHSHVTRNDFAWAEIEQVDDVLLRYEKSKEGRG